MVSADLEVVFSCLLAKLFNLMFRRVELQQRVVYTFRRFWCPQARRLIHSENGWHVFLGFFDDAEPLLISFLVRHIHALRLLSASGNCEEEIEGHGGRPLQSIGKAND